ncbi:CPBP family intramembrane metalloprotease [Aeromonas rivipollensis]|uniref:CPBP family intramembrane glutamic endopeptidase n=1 Tax=Aeromonas rivipollensis TaxID=948519 RepID=UPI00259EA666|nr:CPBP family intramembrane glutamic endopeptidase [Aeromonas rivipollensis]MDM5086340.1 CPBP family intramembrane metalloprotease [Aeromonas rivipollensis]MDM5098859.1 CPBP family intramembrane metalloprotease [Aeromonas rivipollensis]MDM5107178.1 CPBP family intramembrane metalloprotease [Aeromonas rivipollensis]
MLPLPDTLIWLALGLAVLLCLARQQRSGLILLGVALLTALWLERLSPVASLVSLAGLLLAWRTPGLPQPWRGVALTLVLLWAMALTLHLVPGFDNLKVLDRVQAGPASVPFTLYLNLDKPLIFFGLLLAWPALRGPGGTMRWRPLALLILPLAALLITAWQLGALKPDVGLPHWWWLFAFNNLVFTCVAEEALFRGFIQQGVASRSKPWLGLLVASLLFGAAHLAGGPLLVLFAALAGACYGLAFQLSGRLSVAILLHFLFNFAHLALFTYPLASR